MRRAGIVVFFCVKFARFKFYLNHCRARNAWRWKIFFINIFFENQIDQSIINCNVFFLDNTRRQSIPLGIYTRINIYTIFLFYIYTVARHSSSIKIGCFLRNPAFGRLGSSSLLQWRQRIRKHRNVVKKTLHSLNQIKNVLLLLVAFFTCDSWKGPHWKAKSEKLFGSLTIEELQHSVSKWSKVRNRLRVKDQSIRGWKPPTRGRTPCRAHRTCMQSNRIATCCALVQYVSHRCTIKVIHNFMGAKERINRCNDFRVIIAS